jgi:hypothetical protein
MLYSEIIAVCSEIHTKHINTLGGQNVELWNVKHGGTYSNHCAISVGAGGTQSHYTLHPHYTPTHHFLSSQQQPNTSTSAVNGCRSSFSNIKILL